jgi:hypothetical protein
MNIFIKKADVELAQPSDLHVQYDPNQKKLSFAINMRATNKGNDEDTLGLDQATFQSGPGAGELTASDRSLELDDPSRSSWMKVAVPAAGLQQFVARAAFSSVMALGSGHKSLGLHLNGKTKDQRMSLCFDWDRADLPIISGPAGLKLPATDCGGQK